MHASLHKPSSKDTTLNAFLWVLYSQFAYMSALLCRAEGWCWGAWEAADQTQPTKPNNESSRSERRFIHFIFLSLDSGPGPSPYLVTTMKYLIYTQLFWACAALPRRRYCTLLSSPYLMFPPTYLHISNYTTVCLLTLWFDVGCFLYSS